MQWDEAGGVGSIAVIAEIAGIGKPKPSTIARQAATKRNIHHGGTETRRKPKRNSQGENLSSMPFSPLVTPP
jgi:hypothetical protein